MRKLYIQTFGCQMNAYDSAKMAEVLAASHGLEPVTTPEAADVLLINTCSVREKAQEKVFSELGQWRSWKQDKPGRVIGVGGCVASQEGDDLLRRVPFVDIVFGPQTLHRLPALLDSVLTQHKAVVDVSFPEIEKFDHLPAPRAEGPTAFVSIMEGCSKYCTFCVVPYTRGEEISRPVKDVLTEVRALAALGVREVTLLGQNVNAYRGSTQTGGTLDLADLLRVLHAIDGLARLRFTTSHPVEVSASLVQAFADLPKLAGQIHLPVQSGSDRILALMKRQYTVLEYKAIIRKLRAARPDLSLSSDFIVGFPGETEADFAATLRLIDELAFDFAYSFLYSARPGTPAANLPDTTPLAEKKQRLQRLQAKMADLGTAYLEKLVGTVQPVLVEGYSRKDAQMLAGRTGCNRMVNFVAPPRLIGQMVPIKITTALHYSLRGEVATA